MRGLSRSILGAAVFSFASTCAGGVLGAGRVINSQLEVDEEAKRPTLMTFKAQNFGELVNPRSGDLEPHDARVLLDSQYPRLPESDGRAVNPIAHPPKIFGVFSSLPTLLLEWVEVQRSGMPIALFGSRMRETFDCTPRC